MPTFQERALASFKKLREAAAVLNNVCLELEDDLQDLYDDCPEDEEDFLNFLESLKDEVAGFTSSTQDMLNTFDGEGKPLEEENLIPAEEDKEDEDERD